MLQIMKSRGINDYDLPAVIIQQQKKREEAKIQINESIEESLEEIKKGS
jgi:hypothetical protein